MLVGRRVIVKGSKGVDAAVVRVGQLGDTRLAVVLLHLVACPAEPSHGSRDGELAVETRLILNDKGVDAFADMGHGLTDIVGAVDIVLVVASELQVVVVGCCPHEVDIGTQGIVVVDACPPLLALLRGIGEVVVGVECVLERVVPQAALQRQLGCHTRGGMEVELVLIPVGIDAELCPAVHTEIRGDVLLGAHEGIAHDILIGGIGHVAYLGVEVEVTRLGVEALVAVEIGRCCGIAVRQAEVADVAVAQVNLCEPLTPASANVEVTVPERVHVEMQLQGFHRLARDEVDGRSHGVATQEK